MTSIIKALVNDGLYVVVDYVAFGKEDLDKIKEELSSLKILWVGIHCPLNIIEKREKDRGDRTIGFARYFYHNTHKGNNYDLNLDTHTNTLEENTSLILQNLYNK